MLIAQISDIHLAKDNKAKNFHNHCLENFEKTIEKLNNLPHLPDIVLITGDISNDGSKESFIQFRDYISKLKSPFLIVPGNHDEPEVIDEILGDLLEKNNQPEFNDGIYVYSNPKFPLLIMGVSVFDKDYPGGTIKEKSIKALDEELNSSKNIPSIIMFHQPPFKNGNSPFVDMPLKNADKFGDMIKNKRNIQAILCGHLHRYMVSKWNNQLVIASPATSAHCELFIDYGNPFKITDEKPAFLLHYYRKEEGLITNYFNVD
jgi:3',5'-cyclic AMP phosphodiesterase CpdA